MNFVVNFKLFFSFRLISTSTFADLKGTFKGKIYLVPNIRTNKSSIKNSVDFNISLGFCVLRKFKGSCSCVEMLKRYIVRERLGTSGLDSKLH